MDAAYPALGQFNLDIYLHSAHALHIWVSISHINGPCVLCTMEGVPGEAILDLQEGWKSL